MKIGTKLVLLLAAAVFTFWPAAVLGVSALLSCEPDWKAIGGMYCVAALLLWLREVAR